MGDVGAALSAEKQRRQDQRDRAALLSERHHLMVAPSHKPPSRPSAKNRPIFVLEFRAQPGID